MVLDWVEVEAAAAVEELVVVVAAAAAEKEAGAMAAEGLAVGGLVEENKSRTRPARQKTRVHCKRKATTAAGSQTPPHFASSWKPMQSRSGRGATHPALLQPCQRGLHLL